VQYSYGTATVTEGSTTVTGTGTYWTNLTLPLYFKVIPAVGAIYEVASITSDTELELTATWGGVRYAMGAVMGARTPMNVSEEDRKAAYNFLKSYYKKFDKEAPDFKQALKFFGVLFGDRKNIKEWR